MPFVSVLTELGLSQALAELFVSVFWAACVAAGIGAAGVLGLFGWLWRRIEGLNKETKAELRAEINRLNDKFDSLKWDTAQTLRGAAPIAGTSPITLTEVGENIAKAVNARAMVEKYADKVKIDGDAKEFEIQQACFRFALNKWGSLISRDEQDLINKTVFYGGATNSDMVYMVLGVLLRDYHLKDRGFDVPVRKPEGEQAPPPQQQTQNHPHP